MTAITLQGVSKRYGSTVAVDGIDLTIPSGRLFFLLGPSGCGKTTLLRMLAGFIEPNAGRILFDGREVTHLAASKRNLGMVFQSYALWPHMSVMENVAFGLRVRKIKGAEREGRVRDALKMVQMEDYARRKPNQLSGGQQQRVALARALVIRPTILLLDEPLSNLDARLRVEMRMHIRAICDQAKITTVYVTHDQKEALSIADDIAILRSGKVVQVGSPRDLYDHPHSRFVSDFLGEANFIPATIAAWEGDRVIVNTPAGPLTTSTPHPGYETGAAVTCSIRPEAIKIVESATGQNVLPGQRVQTVFMGEVTQHLVQVGSNMALRVLELHSTSSMHKSSDSMNLRIDPTDVVILTLSERRNE